MEITKEPNQKYKYLSTLETYKLPECDWEMQPHVEIADLKMQQWTAERGNNSLEMEIGQIWKAPPRTNKEQNKEKKGRLWHRDLRGLS